jgi:uncharacterized protein (TIGR02145 family)
MKKHIALLLFLITVSIGNKVWAQVTVGSGQKPETGAMLDMKENTGWTSEKGMGLPRVSLSSMTDLFPMFLGDADYENNTDNKKVTEDELHAGMVVYNTNVDLCNNIYAGVYTWNGEEWINLKENIFPSETSVLVDDRNQNETEVYKVGKFGDAGWWMLENLRAKRWPDGTTTGLSLSEPKADTDPEFRNQMYYYPKLSENDLKKNPHHGYAYNLYAAARITQAELSAGATLEGRQGICPNGWHLPTEAEWIELVGAVRENPCLYAHSDIDENTGFNMQSEEDAPNGKSRSSDQGGFNGNLLGSVYYNTTTKVPDVNMLGQRAYFWLSKTPSSPSSLSTGTACLDSETNQAARYPITFINMISVRCKKN